MKVKVRVNPNGVFSVVSASLVEKHVSKFLVIYEVICHGIGTKKIEEIVDDRFNVKSNIYYLHTSFKDILLF